MVTQDAVIKHRGGSKMTADDLWRDGGYKKVASAKVGQSRVIRTRPIFTDWSIEFDLMWDPALIPSKQELIDIIISAGLSGIGDWRPKFGRFELAS